MGSKIKNRKKQTLLSMILIIIFLFALIIASFFDSKQNFNLISILFGVVLLVIIIIGMIIFYNTRGKQDEIKITKEGVYIGQRYLVPKSIKELRNINKLKFQKRGKLLI